jgi:hypothetical protein
MFRIDRPLVDQFLGNHGVEKPLAGPDHGKRVRAALRVGRVPTLDLAHHGLALGQTVGDREAQESAVLAHHIDARPVGEFRHTQARQGFQTPFVIQRLGQERTRPRQKLLTRPRRLDLFEQKRTLQREGALPGDVVQKGAVAFRELFGLREREVDRPENVLPGDEW